MIFNILLIVNTAHENSKTNDELLRLISTFTGSITVCPFCNFASWVCSYCWVWMDCHPGAQVVRGPRGLCLRSVAWIEEGVSVRQDEGPLICLRLGAHNPSMLLRLLFRSSQHSAWKLKNLLVIPVKHILRVKPPFQRATYLVFGKKKPSSPPWRAWSVQQKVIFLKMYWGWAQHETQALLFVA